MKTHELLEGYFAEGQQPLFKEWKALFDLCDNPPPLNTEIGTVVISTRDWLDRVPKGLEIFKDQFTTQKRMAPHLLITGKWSHSLLGPEGGTSVTKLARLARIFGNLTDAMKQRIVVEPQAENTKQQADNVYALLESGKIKAPLSIVSSAYHSPRLFSTFAKTILNKEGGNLKTRLFIVSVAP